jgi:lipopolysaccharide export system permease protein
MKIVDRYLAVSITGSTLLVLLVLLALFSFLQFVDALGDVGKASYQLGDAVRYVLLSLPNQAYVVLPMAALLGTTLGLSALAADSELVAMRAAGVSVMQIVGVAIQVGLVLAILMVLNGEYLVPVSQRMAEEGRNNALRIRAKQQGDRGLWMRDGQNYLHINELLPDMTLQRVDIYHFDESNELRQHVRAERGRLASPGTLTLSVVSESRLGEKRVESRRYNELEAPSALTPELLGVFTVRPEGLSLFQLHQYVNHLEQNRQNAGRYDLAFWQKLTSPFSTVVMMVLAIPFVFGLQRSGGIGARLFTGIVLGLAFFVVSQGFGQYGLLHGVPAVVGAILPTLLFFGAAIVLLRRIR